MRGALPNGFGRLDSTSDAVFSWRVHAVSVSRADGDKSGDAPGRRRGFIQMRRDGVVCLVVSASSLSPAGFLLGLRGETSPDEGVSRRIGGAMTPVVAPFSRAG